jgi:uncharacterized membrane protein (UPF0127 family)
MLFVFSRERHLDIHMLFVFFSIDAIWLDQAGYVVKIVRELQPFTSFVEGAVATYLLEVDAGVADNVRVGDKLTINLKRSDVH